MLTHFHLISGIGELLPLVVDHGAAEVSDVSKMLKTFLRRKIWKHRDIERETEKDRETGRHRKRDRERQRETERDRETYLQREILKTFLKKR